MKKKRLESRVVKGQALKLVQRLEMKFADNTIMDSLKNQNQEIQIKLKEAAGGEAKRKLIVTVEGIHTGLTKNLTFYTPDTLESSVPTWTAPHYKPILTNHNEYSEPLGRIKDVQYVESSLVAGKNTLRMKLEVTNQEAIDKVLDGRFLTLSVGGSANRVVCSTCGKNIIAEGFCGHYRGKTYEGKQDATHWIIGEYTGDEISFVNMPADVFAQVIAAELVTAEGGQSEMNKGKKKKKAGQQDENSELDLIGKLTENEDEEDESNEDEDSNEDNLDEDDDSEDDVNESTNDDDEDDESEDDNDDENEDDDDTEETVEEKVARLEATLAERDQTITDLTTRAENAETQATTLTADNGTLTTELATAKEELSEAQANLASAEEERDTFQEQSIKLAKYSKKLLAERVVDLRIMQKKDKVEDRDSLIETWTASAPKVLESTIKDLMTSGHRFIQRINSPGLALQDQNGDESDDETTITESTAVKPKKNPTFADLEETAIKAMSQRL